MHVHGLFVMIMGADGCGWMHAIRKGAFICMRQLQWLLFACFMVCGFRALGSCVRQPIESSQASPVELVKDGRVSFLCTRVLAVGSTVLQCLIRDLIPSSGVRVL
jgi:hypothetical protein